MAQTYAQQLARYLQSQDSPLAPYAPLIARVENRNRLPRGIISGIAGAETSLGKAGRGPGINNFWGWMDSRGAPYQREFASPEQAIRKYGRFLANNYIGEGMDTPAEIGGMYVLGRRDQPAPAHWLSNVRDVMGQFDPGLPAGAEPSPAAGRMEPAPAQSYQEPRELKQSKAMLEQALQLALGGGDIEQAWQQMMGAAQLMQNMRPAASPPMLPAPRTAPRDPMAAMTGQTVSTDGLRLPMTFDSTHDTDGLPGYPAKDFMADPGTPVGAPAAGTVVKISGSNTWKSGGIGGRTIYIRKPDGGMYFLTHFGPDLKVKVGQKIGRYQLLGYVGNPTSGMAPHIHEGYDAP